MTTEGSTTQTLDRPAVAKYLADLDDALRGRPDPHADELRSQVREHLEDALGADPTDAEIDDALARLGMPHQLAGGEDEPVAAVVYTRPSMTGWLRQRPRGFWAAMIAVMALLVSAAVAVAVETHIAPIDAGCQPCAFAFPEDRLHLRDVPAFDYDHMVVTQRFGQDQAITFTLRNPSRYTQVVRGGQLGLPPRYTAEPMSLDIATVSQGNGQMDQEWPHNFVTHDVAIAPHAYQQVVLHWVQNGCREANGTSTIGGIDLRVTSLGVTRTESVLINEEFTIIGASGRGRCAMGARGHGVFRTRI